MLPAIGRPARRYIAAWLGLFLTIAAVAAHNFNSFQVGAYLDDADYVVLARSIASGPAYGLTNYPGQHGLSQFPFGFPLVLALPARLFPGNLQALKAVSFFATLVNVALLFWAWPWLGGSLSHAWALGVVALYGFFPLVVKHSGMVMSEAIFTTYCLLAVVIAERASRRQAGWGWACLLGVLLLLIAFTRTLGVFVVLAIVAYLLLRGGRRMWKSLVVAGLTTLAGLGLLLALTSVTLADLWPGRYLAMNDTLVSGQGRVTSQGVPYPLLLGRMSMIHMRDDVRAIVVPLGGGANENALGNRLGLPWLRQATGWIIAAIVAWGLVWLLARQGLSAFLLVGLAYYGLMQFVLWVSYRLLYPVQPLLGLGLLLGSAAIGRQLARWARRPAWATVLGHGLAIGAVVAISGISVYKDLQDDASQKHTGDFQRRTAWLAGHSAPDSIVLSELPQIDYLYGQRQSVPLRDYADVADFRTELTRWRVNYILLGPEAKWSTIADPVISNRMRHIMPLIEQLSAAGQLSLVYFDPANNVTVYLVQSSYG